jgi:hypothetical protein
VKHSRRSSSALLVVLALAAAGCNDDSITGPTAPPPDDGETTAVTNTTTASSSTTDAASSSTDIGPTTTARPALPTVSTIIPQVPAPLDPNDPNNRLAPPDTPEEIAIIAAYIEGLDIGIAVRTAPANPDDPRLLDAPLTADVISRTRQGIAEDIAAGRVLDVSGGITYRPYITGYAPGDTEAVVFDCQLDATVWRSIETGEIVDPPSAGFPNSGPDTATEVGIAARLVLDDGRWLMTSTSTSGGAGACV